MDRKKTCSKKNNDVCDVWPSAGFNKVTNTLHLVSCYYYLLFDKV